METIEIDAQVAAVLRECFRRAKRQVDRLVSHRPSADICTLSGRRGEFVTALRREIGWSRDVLGESLAGLLFRSMCEPLAWDDVCVPRMAIGGLRHDVFGMIQRLAAEALVGPSEEPGAETEVGFGGLAEIIGRASSIVGEAERINTGSDAVVRGLVQALS